MIKRSFLLLGLALTFSSPVAAGVNDDIDQRGQYWQRVHTSSALYIRGPKAQQMLNRNIARCVVELRELERLGAVKDAIPEYAEGLVLSEEEARIAGWDTPERDKELFAEHSDYIDFEGCMLAKGWERIKYVPFDVYDQAQNNYKKTHTKYRDEYRNPKKNKSSSDYSNLNE
ncbi:MAG: hypothetical protein ACRBCK_08675 [Alphaproteobacteria bacterium]